MLRNGEVGSHAGLHHDQMAPNLAKRLPASPLESLDGLFAGDIPQLAHGPYTATTMGR